jgi:hypothetical protein
MYVFLVDTCLLLIDKARAKDKTYIYECDERLKSVYKFICIRIKKRRKPRVKIVTLKLC